MTEEQEKYETSLIVNDRRSASIEPVAQYSESGNMVLVAVQKGYDPALIEKMMDLQERHEANEAKKAYVAAMAAFKANPPRIEKDKTVSYPAGGKTVSYTHASLANVTKKINAGLSKHGLSASWETLQNEKEIKVTCTITHKQGHSESTSLTASPDISGSKNAIQAIGSTISYLERYTILALTGLATSDMDNDGGGPETHITEAQAQEIEKIIKDKNIDKSVFLAWAKSDAVKNIPISNYGICIARLNESKGRPKTVPCPDKDGRDVEVSACDKCKARKGCPSWV